MWNRFDIVEAHYAFYVEWHDGMNGSDYVGAQNLNMYERQCRIGEYFKPSPLWRGYESLTDNGKEIYHALETALIEE